MLTDFYQIYSKDFDTVWENSKTLKNAQFFKEFPDNSAKNDENLLMKLELAFNIKFF